MASWHRRGVVLAVGAAQALAALVILTLGDTGPVPMHFGLDGQADRFGDRREAAALTGGMALLTLASPFLLRAMAQRKADAEPQAQSYATLVILLVTSLVIGLMASLAFGLVGRGETPGVAIMAIVGAAFALTGARLGKVGPNPVVGVRTPWTYASRLAWDKANRFAGRLFFWGGLAGLAASPFAPQPAGLQVMIAGSLIIAVAVVFESWRVWRTDPDRRGAL